MRGSSLKDLGPWKCWAVRDCRKP